MSLLLFPEISENSSSVTRGNNYKLLNQTFTTTYVIYTEDTPRLICGSSGTRLVSGARLLSVQLSESDLRPVCGARRLPRAWLLTEVLRYMKWIQDKGQKAAHISTLQYNFSNFGAITVQFWCILSYIRLLKQGKNFLGMGDWGGGAAPAAPL